MIPEWCRLYYLKKIYWESNNLNKNGAHTACESHGGENKGVKQKRNIIWKKKNFECRIGIWYDPMDRKWT